MILNDIAQHPSNHIAISTPSDEVSFGELRANITLVSKWLTANTVKVLLLESDNSPEWVYIDLACQQAGVIFVPVPQFFSQDQLNNVISRVKPDIVIKTSDPDSSWRTFIYPIFQYKKFDVSSLAHFPEGTSKVTFTSGSTGEPKGVCLSIDNQYKVAKSLIASIGITEPKHFCLLSFSTLLENVAGIYAPLMAGGQIVIHSDRERGFNGATISSPQLLLASISRANPNTLILVPELLQFLLHAVKGGWTFPKAMAFMAVGGSRVSPELLTQAELVDLPVFQGYGLSECASVVSLNNRNHSEKQSAGKVLPHLQVEIVDGELVVSGNVFLGYLGSPDSWYKTKVKTGDIASIHNNHVNIMGRSSNLIINSFGRNVSPEWVESELLATGVFSQVVVVGDAKPFLVALVHPANNQIVEPKIKTIIEQVNRKLPEFAQIKNSHILSMPLSFERGQLTTNGRPRRHKIGQDFFYQIEALYSADIEKEYEHETI